LDDLKNKEKIEQLLNSNSKILFTDMTLNEKSLQPNETNSHSEQNHLEKTRFLVKHSSKLLSIEVDQIAFFYAENRLNFIRTWNNKTYIIDKTIEELSLLLNKKDFFRINRSFIVSYKSIEEVYTHFNSRLKLKLIVSVPEELFVSKDRASDFKVWLGA
jgi:two-component system LytT family response regulator